MNDTSVQILENYTVLYSKALECYEDAERVFIENKNPKMTVNTIHHRGYVQLKLGEEIISTNVQS